MKKFSIYIFIAVLSLIITAIAQHKWKYIAGTADTAIYFKPATQRTYYCHDKNGNVYKNLYAEYKFVELTNNSYSIKGISFDNTSHFAYKFIKWFDKLGNMYDFIDYKDFECSNMRIWGYDIITLHNDLLPKLMYEQPKSIKNNALTSNTSNVEPVAQTQNKSVSKVNKVEPIEVEYKPSFEFIN